MTLSSSRKKRAVNHKNLPTSMAVSMKLFCLEANSANNFCCLSLAFCRLRERKRGEWGEMWKGKE